MGEGANDYHWVFRPTRICTALFITKKRSENDIMCSFYISTFFFKIVTKSEPVVMNTVTAFQFKLLILNI